MRATSVRSSLSRRDGFTMTARTRESAKASTDANRISPTSAAVSVRMSEQEGHRALDARRSLFDAMVGDVVLELHDERVPRLPGGAENDQVHVALARRGLVLVPPDQGDMPPDVHAALQVEPPLARAMPGRLAGQLAHHLEPPVRPW